VGQNPPRQTGLYFALVIGGIAMQATQMLVIAIIMPTIVADIGGAAYYTWAAMLCTIGAVVGASSTGVVWSRFGPRRGLRPWYRRIRIEHGGLRARALRQVYWCPDVAHVGARDMLRDPGVSCFCAIADHDYSHVRGFWRSDCSRPFGDGENIKSKACRDEVGLPPHRARIPIDLGFSQSRARSPWRRVRSILVAAAPL